MLKDYKNILFVGFIIAILVLMLLLRENSENENAKVKRVITVSSFILYDIVKHIAEDSMEIVRIIPPGVDIHSFAPTPKIMAKIERSDLVLYSGAGLEPWLSSFDFKNRSVGIGNFIHLRSLGEFEFDIHQHHDHKCAHTTLDPHFWLDVENMKRATDIITYEFISLSPKNKTKYLQNRDKYLKSLEKIDAMYKEKLHTCTLETIITNHNAFSYLSDKYGFNIRSLTGLSADKEASPKDIIRITQDIKESNTEVIFYENFSTNKPMKNLAKELGVTLDSLHPLGNITKDEDAQNVTYEEIMIQNLEKIAEALICH